jgi:hypothetical protein
MRTRSIAHLVLAVLIAQTSFAQILIDDGDGVGTGPRPPRDRGVRLPGGPTIVTDGPTGNSPIPIKIPPLPDPILDPVTPPNRPNKPIIPNQPGMQGVGQSMIQGASCPLVDNRPYADLTAAVNNLYQHINPVADCEKDANLEQVNKAVQQMKASAEIAQRYWNDPNAMQLKPGANPEDQAAIDPKYMDENIILYSNAVTGTLENLKIVADALSNNAFVKSSCGKQLLSFSGIIKSLGDVATSITPMALLGAAANPANKPLLAAVLGVSTFGAVSQVVRQVVNAGVMDMRKPENRLILLQNTCEFSKIADRVRYLKLAQAGQIAEVTEEIRLAKTNAMRTMQMNMSPRLQQVILIRDNIRKELNEANKRLRQDNNDFKNEIQSKLRQSGKDNFQICNLAETVVDAITPGEFPATILENYQSLLENQQKITLGQRSLLNAERKSREQLIKLRDSKSLSTLKCAEVGNAYLNTLATIIKDTQATIRSHSAAIRQKISEDPDGGPFQDKEDKVIQDTEDMNKILSVIEKLKDDTAAPDKAEMNDQLYVLKRALFGDSEGWLAMIGYKGQSPALGWLTVMDENHSMALQRMQNEWNVLRAGSCRLTKSGCVVPVQTRKESIGLNEFEKQQLSQYLDDIKVADQLSNVTLDIAPPGTEQNVLICRRLENAYLEWVSVWDFLGAQGLFCRVIEPMFDSTVQKKIHNHCLDDKRYDGKTLKLSLLNTRVQALVSSGYKAKAQLITKKMDELQCDLPSALE